ncbi:MAG: hypothetical protein KIT84_31040 [Labilithrix sp.]|nr:hypothetical protein [Labilithrix sp.]MCW5815505.1 hypothetical protein [Labilithrix sp.]
MPGPAFDPNGAVRFDMTNGATSDSRGTRFLLVPAAALEALDRTTPGALAHLGAEVGRACGARVAASLGGDGGVRASTLEVVVTHLAGELAIAGLGSVTVERWGRALVVVLTNPNVNSDGFLAAALAGAVGFAAGRDVCMIPIGREGNVLRFLIGTSQTMIRCRSLVSSGKTWMEILSALQPKVST